MNPADVDLWRQQNQTFLLHALDELHLRLAAPNGDTDGSAEDELATSPLAEQMAYPPALLRIADAFDLSRIERDVLVLALGFELDPRFTDGYGRLTVGTALSMVPAGHWSLFAQSGPLRRWRLIQVDDDTSLVAATLRLDAYVFEILLGLADRLPRELSLLGEVPPAEPVLASWREQAVDLAAVILAEAEGGQPSHLLPVVHLYGAGSRERAAVARLLCDELNASVFRASMADLPPPGKNLERMAVTWNRHSRLTSSLLLLEARNDHAAPRDRRLDQLLALLQAPVLLSAPLPRPVDTVRSQLPAFVRPLGPDDRGAVWRVCLAEGNDGIDDDRLAAAAHDLAATFRFDAGETAAICRQAAALVGRVDRADHDRTTTLLERVHAGCRARVRMQLDAVGARIPAPTHRDVPLPAELAELETRIKDRDRAPLTGPMVLLTGLGCATSVALSLAVRVEMDLYRVDVATLLGAADQSAARLLGGIAMGGAILLLTRAELLFGGHTDHNLAAARLWQQVRTSPAPILLASRHPRTPDGEPIDIDIDIVEVTDRSAQPRSSR